MWQHTSKVNAPLGAEKIRHNTRVRERVTDPTTRSTTDGISSRASIRLYVVQLKHKTLRVNPPNKSAESYRLLSSSVVILR